MEEKNIRACLIVVYSTNPEKSVSFYGKIGFNFFLEKHSSGPSHYSAILENIVFEIYPSEGRPPGVSSSMIGFEVQHVEKTVSELIAAGFLEPSEIKKKRNGAAILNDPDGNKIYLQTRSEGGRFV